MVRRTASLAYRWLSLVVLTLGLAAPVAAQPNGPEPGAEARAVELFQRGVEAYRQGRFEEAAEAFQSAHEHRPDAILVYNLARALENAGDIEGAAAAYRRYLEGDVPDDERPGIEARVNRLEHRIEERRRLEARAREEQRAPSPPSTPPTSRDPVLEATPWVIGGLGVAALGAGTVLGVLALDTHAQSQVEPVHETAIALEHTAHAEATAANVSWVAGGVLLGAAVLWLIVAALGDDDAGAEVARRLQPSDARERRVASFAFEL